MFVRVPKIRKSDGKMVMTTIQPKDAIGFEDTILTHNGKQWQGCKIYTHGGKFKVFASEAAICAAIAEALTTGNPVTLELNGNMSKSIPAPAPKVHAITQSHIKVVTSGGWVAATGWAKLTSGN